MSTIDENGLDEILGLQSLDVGDELANEEPENEQMQCNGGMKPPGINENTIDELNSRIKKLEKELETQKDLYLRLAAEYDNYRKRTEKDRLLIYGDAIANTVVNVLPIADSLDAAVKSFSSAPAEYKTGISLLVNQLNVSFKKLGIEAFGVEGDVFNPEGYEAISHIEDESLGENIVVEVLRKGYKLKDKVIRCAMVKVAN